MMDASQYRKFSYRHIGPDNDEIQEMLSEINSDTLGSLIKETIPDDILLKEKPNLPEAMSEAQYLRHIEALGEKNEIFRSYIGMGYYGTNVPSPILRNIFENPSWYTQYTPYQAEISQGRLQALLNFQTMISDLTGLPLANASLLDEGTAAAEAMAMFHSKVNKKRRKNPAKKFFVDEKVFPQTLAVLEGRAEPLDIEIVSGDHREFEPSDDYFGALFQYPDAEGSIQDSLEAFVGKCAENKILTVCATDLLALTILKAPGEFNVDAAVGNTQRFGVPVGAGGPHAGFFATTDKFKRQVPGRIIGVSYDKHENIALRMALQTREQHIKREKATSNICTAQALLAIMAGMYAVYHGAEGLKGMALDIHRKTVALSKELESLGYQLINDTFFDTLTVKTESNIQDKVLELSHEKRINFAYPDDETVRFSLDETVLEEDLQDIVTIFRAAMDNENNDKLSISDEQRIPSGYERESDYLTHEVFKRYRNETELMRYIKHLEKRDLSLTHSMIPLGSCTMKLNAASELLPLSRPEWNSIHPFAPLNQRQAYIEMMDDLRKYLAEITGFTACSLQPNSGAQGELTGLLTIREYHIDRGEDHRNVVLIPDSAHGTNPASGVMSGMKVVVVKCDDNGNIDVDDLREKAEKHKDNLSALMVTYPSTHGVFEKAIRKICQIIHDNGGLIYMDGANMNAQVGYTSPGAIGADVCHLNLHKTFAIPHGGGGPGMGPICVNDKLKDYLPGHPLEKTGGEKGISAVASAPFGSALILLVSYAYIRMLGLEGLMKATQVAILNANYIAKRLSKDYQILYTGEEGRSAHELIVDLRPFKAVGISAEDVTKRLIDYGFHAPTLSFPVPGTIMIEPTESENKEELDRFCNALLEIKAEIDEVAEGKYAEDNNVLVNAPHTIQEMTSDEWSFPYSRQKACWPLDYVRHGHKFWVSVGRVDNAYGDRNLMCTCPPMSEYEE